MHPELPRTPMRTLGAAMLLLGGTAAIALGVLVAALGLVDCAYGSCTSGHIPGLPVIAEGAVIALIGRWAFRKGRKLQKTESTDNEVSAR